MPAFELPAKREVSIMIAVVAHVVIGLYFGHELGYKEGFAAGAKAGEVMGSNVCVADRFQALAETHSGRGRVLLDTLCDGFRTGLECGTQADALHLTQSSKPFERLLGTTCLDILRKIDHCGNADGTRGEAGASLPPGNARMPSRLKESGHVVE